MKKLRLNLSKILLLAMSLTAVAAQGAVIYSTDFVETPSGAASTFSKGDFKTAAVSWASDYNAYFLTSGSAGTVTYTFSPAIDLSSSSNTKLVVYWGSTSNRPLKVGINGGSDTQIDAVASSADRSQVRTAETALTVSSVSSLKFISSGGGNVYLFRLEITGDAACSGPVISAQPATADASYKIGAAATPLTVTATGSGTLTYQWYSNSSASYAGATPVSGATNASFTPSTASAGTAYYYCQVKSSDCSVATNSAFSGAITVAAKSSDATLATLTYNGTAVPGFSAAKTSYTVYLDAGTTNVPVVAATANNADATAVVTQAASVSGTASVLVTAEDGTTKTYTVTFIVGTPPALSSDATLSSLKYNGTAVPSFSANTTSYSVTLPNGTTTAPTITATANDANATVSITQPASPTATASVLVTAEDGTTTKTYTVSFSVAPPSSGLTCHETEIYEAEPDLGGYGKPLVVHNNRDYEVFYMTRDGDSKFCIATTSADKTAGITTRSSDYACTANDGWFSFSGTGWSSASDNVGDEFGTMARRLDMDNTCEFSMHFRGYDQFALVARDKKRDDSSGGTKPENNRYLEVYIDNVLQPQQFNTNPSIRRYDISTGEHVVRVVHTGSEKSAMYAFSLRVAYVPKVKYVSGNDSSQTVLQTKAIRPVTYFLKNRISDAELTWNGPEATGITLQKGNADTIRLAGTALCPNGTYNYTISAKDENNTVISSRTGKFNVGSAIEFTAAGDSDVVAYEKTSMSPVVIKYYSINASDVSWAWTGNTPAGLTFATDASNNTVSLSGTPTSVGSFAYTVSIAGGNTLHGTVTIESNSPVVVPGASKTMLYLFKERSNKTKGAFSYLTSKYNYFARQAGGKMLNAADYNQYDFIVISEDVDANNEEVLSVIRSLGKPVLNMKIFTYTASRLNWGDPDNGSVNRTKIGVRLASHPIFQSLSHDSIDVISSIADNRGLMVADVNVQGGMCLATSAKRGLDYSDDGKEAVFIHEIPASIRGAKYLTFPVGHNSLANLTPNGKKLLDNIIAYLCSGDNFTNSPELRITSFVIDGVKAQINDAEGTINITLPEGTDLTALTPQITLADNSTFVTPGSGETVDLSSTYFGKKFVVSDYVNKKVYTARATVKQPDALDDIENGLALQGLVLHNDNNIWLNVFNASGMLVTTTNSDIDFNQFARGIYLIVTADGKTLKLAR